MVTDLPGEVWKAIKGYETHYMVSNLGRVKGLERQVPGKAGSIRTLPEKLLSATDNGRGYLKVGLKKDGEKRYIVKVHRLVAEAFIPNPDNKEQVNHIDGNKYNNNADNLEWTTGTENCQHRNKEGLANTELNTRNIRRKLAQLDENGNIISVFNSQKEAMEATGLKDSKEIGKVANGFKKSYCGTYWKYID